MKGLRSAPAILVILFFAAGVRPILAQSRPPATTEGAASAPSPEAVAGTSSTSAASSASKAAAGDVPPGHGLHSVTVTFDYNFTVTPACTQKIREHCIQRFVAYDISDGVSHRSRLFDIPVPDGAEGEMHGITATSPKLDFQSGRHLLAVTAQEPSGVESKHYAATVWVVIP